MRPESASILPSPFTIARLGRSDESHAARARVREDGKTVSSQRHMSCIYSRCVNAELPIEDVLATSFPWCAGWAANCSSCSLSMARGEATTECPRLRRFAALLGRIWSAIQPLPARSRSASTMCLRRVSGHEPLQASILLAFEARRARPHRSRRQCTVDLFVSRRDGQF